MHSNDDEKEEWRRLTAKRDGLSPFDRWYDELPTTRSGDENLQKNRRTNRITQMSFRMQPRIRNMVVAIVKRDRPPSLVVLFEQMLARFIRRAD